MMQKEEKQVKVSQIMPSIKKRNRLTKRLIFNIDSQKYLMSSDEG
ncbi:hypothetical protein HMPREF3199_02642 [Enterococcus faecium]|jgi:hypothetical protein|nr:hypothetical protein HMPREF0352_1523 [Enterococcus faecium TX1330]KXA05693.1 hypothetical protein HMPREF3199_02642 [Enterococcus faecium]